MIILACLTCSSRIMKRSTRATAVLAAALVAALLACAALPLAAAQAFASAGAGGAQVPMDTLSLLRL